MDLNSIPIGSILAFSFKEATLGWLACDGRYHLKEDYPLLFKTIGTTFGIIAMKPVLIEVKAMTSKRKITINA